MRLFLASQGFGNHLAKLHEMVGDNKKVLVIFNARDDISKEARDDVVSRKRKDFTNSGFIFAELDLRNYFGKMNELDNFISEYKPGLISSVGGNTFLLKYAFNQSGLSEILVRDLKDDKYVYSGYSAGSMIASPDYYFFDRGDRPKQVRLVYKSDPDYIGLNLIDGYISPHADTPGHIDITKERDKEIMTKGLRPITLRDSDVYVVDGDKDMILR